MNFRHLYNATIAKEVVSSALMAMAFESLPSFRAFMFGLIDAENRFNLNSCEWSVGVEQSTDTGRCDILLESSHHIVIIEMKIKPGALQDSQLVKYFEYGKVQFPGRSVIAVLVSPGAVGPGEIQKVKASKHFSDKNDHTLQISWEKIAQYYCSDETEFGCAYSETLAYLKELMDSQKHNKYSTEGGRGDVRKAIKHSALILNEKYGEGHFRCFNGWDEEELFTTHSNVTISAVVNLRKAAADEKRLVSVYNEDGQISARIKFKFKLSSSGTKNQSLKRMWAIQKKEFCKHIGQAVFVEFDSMWLSSGLSEFVGTSDELIILITEQTISIIDCIQGALAKNGFPLFH